MNLSKSLNRQLKRDCKLLSLLPRSLQLRRLPETSRELKPLTSKRKAHTRNKQLTKPRPRRSKLSRKLPPPSQSSQWQRRKW